MFLWVGLDTQSLRCDREQRRDVSEDFVRVTGPLIGYEAALGVKSQAYF